MSLLSKIKIIERKKIEDSRGWFLKVINGVEEGLLKSGNFEIYLTKSIGGFSKGGHYHNIANEWFTAIEGSCSLYLIDVLSGEELIISLNANKPRTVYVPSNVAHLFESQDENDFLVLAYTDTLFDPRDTISYTFGKELQ
jgi:dTDP-4-dehydrorhamnose 3,5-epimerase-like enzyme